MKLRYFLRGLGAGIIFTVLVLTISGHGAEKEVLTDNEIIARARELGMVTKDEKIDESLSQLINTQKTQDVEENEASTEAGQEAEEEDGENPEGVLEDMDNTTDALEENETEEGLGDNNEENTENTSKEKDVTGNASGKTEVVVPKPSKDKKAAVTSGSIRVGGNGKK